MPVPAGLPAAHTGTKPLSEPLIPRTLGAQNRSSPGREEERASASSSSSASTESLEPLVLKPRLSALAESEASEALSVPGSPPAPGPRGSAGPAAPPLAAGLPGRRSEHESGSQESSESLQARDS